MKALSMNRLAYSGIRANRKHYRLLAASVFLAVFIAVGTVLTIGAMQEKVARQRQARYGREDAFFFDAGEVQPDTMVSQGLASKVGTVTLTGSVRGFPMGYYDETAASLLCRHPLEGRMPEAAGEIAMALTALEQLYPGRQVGQPGHAPDPSLPTGGLGRRQSASGSSLPFQLNPGRASGSLSPGGPAGN